MNRNLKQSCRTGSSWVGIVLTVAASAGAGLGFAAWWAMSQTSYVPDFYERAKLQTPAKVAEASRRLETDVQQLQDDAARRGTWRAAFSDDEINAWLIQELPTKFPKLLAKGASEPRVLIGDDRILAAVRYKDRHFDTIISCEVTAELTEEPNMLAIRVRNLRAGALPLPLHQFIKGISKEAASGGVDIRWDMTDDGPVALVAVPSEHPAYAHKPVIVESVKLIDGQLLLAGHTGPEARDAYKPRGSIHRFVSYRVADNRNCSPSRSASKQTMEVTR